ncbi:hypothetical protein HD554DRAFT_2205105 [Boletus coccyginus]|nr:hypothetical protein HD554DRAFT_2205105 [Boletus coccyginus]
MSLASSQSAQIPRIRSQLLRSPAVKDLEEQELDVDLVPKGHINVLLTHRAAEQLRQISTREGNPDVALRISVESGGCHGYQYKLGLAGVRAPEDYHLTHPDIRPSNLYIDAVSLPMLNGSTVDYATELIGSSFRVTGNPQAKGGCGCGVSWELND